jgi:hypothetical protein
VNPWKRVRALLGADVVSTPRRPMDDAEERKRAERAERALMQADKALARRRVLDAEVDRVEYYLKGNGA